ncbi:S-formylglutathione hydrolase [Porticoccaceae bacterium]|jgi:S-formylglutathione hydrolase|nr:S-formylglutathione hydrolase [Porticoccaceae bacterium]MDA7696772.1 S-formylglutathione hydrolase [Porticoccaceae bacterium]MDA8598802.1 S-formylglutathione hydrolase [Porticoccaceae bacterium]MDA9583013.1 S-formylglutathione hydrolase [Porticoccaceae bacterium]MDB2559397.1 S-formylglutathione hydrolase [Porticoccaceae bacterium]|tara:strand:+ start:201 stop:1067 length:867 start_codon:yes stop_codon:yes gene_type:complete
MSDSLVEEIGSNLSFGGQQLRYRHHSNILNCDMTFSIYLPPQAKQAPVPVLYWLSGLTCSDENFVTKAGAQQHAAEYGIAIVCPDTSPRGEGVPDDEESAYDFGLGAGFYINATEQPWATHYQMYDYVVEELPALINAEFPVDGSKVAISGHSMGGHGALTVALKNPERYCSVSAFSPICSPINCPWGQKALSKYIGDESQGHWNSQDTVELVKTADDQLKQSMPVLVDQGDADNFLAEQLNTQLLIDTAEQVGFPMQIRFQSGYDHSYFFIASLIGEHIRFHSNYLS